MPKKKPAKPPPNKPCPSQPFITLHQYYAGKAMNTLLQRTDGSQPRDNIDTATMQKVAKLSHEMASWMIDEE